MLTVRQGRAGIWISHRIISRLKIHCDMRGRAQLVLTQSLYRSNAFFEGSLSPSTSCTHSDSQKLI